MSLDDTIDLPRRKDPASAALEKSRRMGWVWGTWLTLFPIAEFLLRPRYGNHAGNLAEEMRSTPPGLAATLLIILVLGCVPAAISWLRLGIDFRRSKPLITILLPILIFVFVSLIGIDSPSPFGNALGLA